jgi:hypothetical protein
MPYGGYQLAQGGADTGSLQVFKVAGINLLATGQTLVVPAASGRKWIPLSVRTRLASLTGVFVVAPIVRLGNNGSFDNMAPLFTVAALAVDGVDVVPIVTAVTAVNIGSTGISLDVQTAGTVATVATADVFVLGYFA